MHATARLAAEVSDYDAQVCDIVAPHYHLLDFYFLSLNLSCSKYFEWNTMQSWDFSFFIAEYDIKY